MPLTLVTETLIKQENDMKLTLKNSQKEILARVQDMYIEMEATRIQNAKILKSVAGEELRRMKRVPA